MAERRAQGLTRRLESLREGLGERFRFDQIAGTSVALRAALEAAAKVAPTETTVLIAGESGTGKELVALAIHHASQRAHGPFLAVNCAALSGHLARVRAVRSRARRLYRRGSPEARPLRAGGGRRRSWMRWASCTRPCKPSSSASCRNTSSSASSRTTTLKADVRVIAATNQVLEHAVDAGTFRADLYYRLNVFTVTLPPLRERGDDIRLLAEHFSREMAPSMGKETVTFTADALTTLSGHPWRGNIRELRNAVERALIVSDGELIAARISRCRRPRRASWRIAPIRRCSRRPFPGRSPPISNGSRSSTHWARPRKRRLGPPGTSGSRARSSTRG